MLMLLELDLGSQPAALLHKLAASFKKIVTNLMGTNWGLLWSHAITWPSNLHNEDFVKGAWIACAGILIFEKELDLSLIKLPMETRLLRTSRRVGKKLIRSRETLPRFSVQVTRILSYLHKYSPPCRTIRLSPWRPHPRQSHHAKASWKFQTNPQSLFPSTYVFISQKAARRRYPEALPSHFSAQANALS